MPGETAASESGFTVDTAMRILNQRIDDLIVLLNERYETQTKTTDTAFSASQTAMVTALAAAERAVQTALASAKEAVVKSELASDKRFESVNEFRAQLGDQARTFATKESVDVQLSTLTERIRELTAASAVFITRVEHDALIDRIARAEKVLGETKAHGAGLQAGWAYLIGAIGASGIVIGIVLAFNGQGG